MCLSCLNLPTAVCRKLCDRTQGAEGPLGAAIRQCCRVTGNRAETFDFTLREHAGQNFYFPKFNTPDFENVIE